MCSAFSKKYLILVWHVSYIKSLFYINIILYFTFISFRVTDKKMFFDFNFKKMVAKTSPIVGIVRIITTAHFH